MRTVFIVAAASVAALLAVAGDAQAQATRVFVSGFGLDSNPCSLGEPCRTFQQAENTVAAGGEIVALDSAGYGPLNITKAVTVTAIGVAASITSTSTSPGININAGTADVVAIRGLTLFPGTNSSGDGIDIVQAKSITIRDCTISGFPQFGIAVVTDANLNVELEGVTAYNNGDTGLFGFLIGASTELTLLVTDSSFSGNGVDGVSLGATFSTATVNATLNLTAAANGSRGVAVGPSGTVMVTASKVINNVVSGLLVAGPVKVFVDRTQISGNGGNGWEASGGAAASSYGNNEVNGNGNDGLNGVTQISSQ